MGVKDDLDRNGDEGSRSCGAVLATYVPQGIKFKGREKQHTYVASCARSTGNLRSKIGLAKVLVNRRDVYTMVFARFFAQSFNDRLTLRHVTRPSNLPPQMYMCNIIQYVSDCNI